MQKSAQEQRVFVTGGNGFIGSRVVRRLTERGYAVRCLFRVTSVTERIDDLPLERVFGDVLDTAPLLHACDDSDAVIHLAGTSSWKDIRSGGLVRTAVEGTRNVLSIAARRNLKTVVVSSNAVTGGSTRPIAFVEDAPMPPVNVRRYTYAFAKQRVEELSAEAVRAGLPVVVVRPTEVYGPDDCDMITAGNLVDFARSNPVFVPTGGTGVVHVDDVAEGIVVAMERGKAGERYNLSGDNLTVRELADMTLRLLGQRRRVVTLPNGFLTTIARVGGRLRIPLPFEPNVIPYAVRYWYADNTKARRELGVEFRSAEETLRPTLGWLEGEGYVKSSSEMHA